MLPLVIILLKALFLCESTVTVKKGSNFVFTISGLSVSSLFWECPLWKTSVEGGDDDRR